MRVFAFIFGFEFQLCADPLGFDVGAFTLDESSTHRPIFPCEQTQKVWRSLAATVNMDALLVDRKAIKPLPPYHVPRQLKAGEGFGYF
jgi:hypothetical protein